MKAVKVHFREGMNGQVGLDFNIYLSPSDHWSGVITESFSNSIGTRLRTAEMSCTVPAIPPEGLTMETAAFAADSVNYERAHKEGYEVIEMGVVTGSLAMDATHVSGVPTNCGSLAVAWNGGVWASDPTADMQPALGGLSGYGVLINCLVP